MDKDSKPKRIRVTPNSKMEFDDFFPKFVPSSPPHISTPSLNTASTPIPAFSTPPTMNLQSIMEEPSSQTLPSSEGPVLNPNPITSVSPDGRQVVVSSNPSDLQESRDPIFSSLKMLSTVFKNHASSSEFCEVLSNLTNPEVCSSRQSLENELGLLKAECEKLRHENDQRKNDSLDCVLLRKRNEELKGISLHLLYAYHPACLFISFLRLTCIHPCFL